MRSAERECHHLGEAPTACGRTPKRPQAYTAQHTGLLQAITFHAAHPAAPARGYARWVSAGSSENGGGSGDNQHMAQGTMWPPPGCARAGHDCSLGYGEHKAGARCRAPVARDDAGPHTTTCSCGGLSRGSLRYSRHLGPHVMRRCQVRIR